MKIITTLVLLISLAACNSERRVIVLDDGKVVSPHSWRCFNGVLLNYYDNNVFDGDGNPVRCKGYEMLSEEEYQKRRR